MWGYKVKGLKKYVFYGSSILFSRGLEYLVLLLAPLYLTKETYGDLEFYKKIIELGAAMLTFGLPTLILSYPKSQESKIYFTIISLLFISVIGIFCAPFLYVFKYLFLLIPIYFYSVFFNNGIIAPFILTSKGSNSASIYKAIVSLVFYTIVLASVFYASSPQFAFVYVNYIILPFILIYTGFYVYKQNIEIQKLKSYWRLFTRLLSSSLTIVVSNFANMTFLYTDILIIKLLSQNSSVDIADYSFSLNIANALILVPLTLVQVDIEKLKKNMAHASILRKRILFAIIGLSIGLILVFLFLTHFYFQDYRPIFDVFLVILVAKIFQSVSVSYGAQIIIKKLFKQNLTINLLALTLNIALSYVLYYYFGLLGIALASLMSLSLRFLLLARINRD